MDAFTPHAFTLPPQALPLFQSPVRAGFPSPADDYSERRLDLNELIRHPEATYFTHAQGDSMVEFGIRDGDLLVVDRAELAQPGKIVVAEVNGEFTVKKLGRGILLAGNPAYPPIPINPESGVTIWGVVSYVIHAPGDHERRRVVP